MSNVNVYPGLDESASVGNVIKNYVGLFERASDPAAVPDTGFQYGKDVAGVTQLFYRASDGTVSQLTPPAAGGTFFSQGGNSFGALAVLGTNDAFDLAIRTNGVNQWSFTTAGQFLSPDGTILAPPISWSSDPTSGISFSVAAGPTSIMSFSAGSVERMQITGGATNQVLLQAGGTEAEPVLGFIGDVDTGVFYQAANAYGLTAGSLEVARVSNNAGALQVLLGVGGSIGDNFPQLSFIGDDQTGLFYVGPTTFGITAGGTELVQFTGSGTSQILMADGSLAEPILSFFSDGSSGFFLESGGGDIRVAIGGATLLAFIDEGPGPQLRTIDGSAATPAYAFLSSPGEGYGFFRGTGVGVALAGVEAAMFTDQDGTQQLLMSGGSVSFSSFSFSGDSDTGVFHPTDDEVAFAAGGSKIFSATLTGAVLSGPTTDLSFESADGQTAAVSGAATGRLRYNNATATWQVSVQTGPYVDLLTTASGTFFAQDGNSFGAVATLGTNDAFDLELETDGTSRWGIDTGGQMYAVADGVYDIGNKNAIVNTNRPRNVYITDDFNALGFIVFAAGNIATNTITLEHFNNTGNNRNFEFPCGVAANALVVCRDTNPVLGDTLYYATDGAAPNPQATALPGNITATKKFLSQTGTGAISAAPSWEAVASGDVSGFAFVQNGNSFGALATLGTNDAFDLAFETTNVVRGRFLAGGGQIVGTATALLGTEMLLARNDQNLPTYINVANKTAGTLSEVYLQLESDTNLLRVGHTSSTFTTANGIVANSGFVESVTGNLFLSTRGAATIRYLINGTEQARWLATNTLQGNGGMTLQGGSAASNVLTLSSTSSATKGTIDSDSVFHGPSGTAALPTFAFTTDVDTGFFRIVNNALGLATGGAERVRFSDTAVGMFTGSGTSGVGLHLQASSGTGNNVLTVLRVDRVTSVAAAAGIGCRLMFDVENSGGSAFDAASISAVVTTVTAAAEVAGLTFAISLAGTLTNVLQFAATTEAGGVFDLRPTTDNQGNLGTNDLRLFSVNVASTTGLSLWNAAADANPTGHLFDASLTFGAGGASAVDLRVSRSAASTLRVDDNAAGAATVVGGADNVLVVGTAALRLASVSSVAFNVFAAASDANPTAALTTNALSFGAGGGTAVDTVLSRGAANRLDLAAGDSFRINTDRGILFEGTQTSGAGASIGTLTNAPHAGDPDFWLKVVVNGTNVTIPCWNG